VTADSPSRSVDADFLALPLDACADAALSRASELGASHADVRVVVTQTSLMSLRDARLDGSVLDRDSGLAVRVIVDGCWGFASSDVIDVDTARALADRAVRLARISAPLTTSRVELAPEPVNVGAWVSAYDVDPFSVAESERLELLASRSATLLAHEAVAHVTAGVHAVKTQVFYADVSGTRTTQQRVRIESDITAIAVDETSGAFETMATTAPPTGRGWEYVAGTATTKGGARAWDWETELAELGDHLAAKTRAPSVEPRRYDLVIHPTNLWLTIHESIGHATELDRALGYEANYAGTSFATPDKLNHL
jgi:TldD protein